MQEREKASSFPLQEMLHFAGSGITLGGVQNTDLALLKEKKKKPEPICLSALAMKLPCKSAC